MSRWIPIPISILILTLFAGLFAVGCASLPEPGWFQELRAREAAAVPAQRIESADHFFRAQVPARPGEVQAGDEVYSVSFDADAVAPVDCWIYTDGIDFAGSLSGLSEETFGVIEASIGPIEMRQIDHVDAGVLHESPYLALDWVYRARSPEGPRVGQVKHLVASVDGRGVYCQHHALGYTETFRRVVGALLESLEYTQPLGEAPYFSEISVMSVKGMKVGVGHTTLTRDGDIDTRVDSITSMIIPVTGDTLQVNDTFAVEFSRPDGTLINQTHVESQNGELVSHLELLPDRDSKGAWNVKGTFQGKPLSTRIVSSNTPSSWLGDAMALRGALASEGPGAAVTTTRWVPDADPTRLIDGTVAVGERVGPQRYAAKLATEGLEADLVVDREGTVAAGSIDMGTAAVEFERVYTGGRF